MTPRSIRVCAARRRCVEKGGKEPLVREGAKLTKGLIAKLKAAGVKEIPLAPSELVGRAVLTELVDSKKNKLVEKNQRLTAEIVEEMLESEIEEFKVDLSLIRRRQRR